METLGSCVRIWAPSSNTDAINTGGLPWRVTKAELMLCSATVMSNHQRHSLFLKIPATPHWFAGIAITNRIETRYDSLIDRLREAAKLDRDEPPAARAYLDTVRRHAYRATDQDVAELRARGLPEDEIFELTVAAAVGAGLERLAAGLEALR